MNIQRLLKNSGYTVSRHDIDESDYKIVINNITTKEGDFDRLIRGLNKLFSDRCVNYNAWADKITILKNCEEATNCSSIGQHKRSSIDLIPNYEEDDNMELDIDETTFYDPIDASDDAEYLVEEDDDESSETEEEDGEYLEIDTTLNTDTSDDTDTNTSSDDEEIYTADIVDTEDNIDSQDSTNPMDDLKNRRSGSKSISI